MDRNGSVDGTSISATRHEANQLDKWHSCGSISLYEYFVSNSRVFCHLIHVFFCRTSLNAFHAQSLNDEAQIKANLTAFACSIVYLTSYFYYVPAKEKPLTAKIILIGAGFIGSFYFYINVRN